MAADILIVDDEDDIRGLVAGILEDEGYGARLARNSDEAIAAVEARRPQLILLDIWLQGSKLDGLQLLEAIKRQHPNVPVVMISGHGNIETAVRAIKLGAYDFIEKPFKADRLILIAERALETSRLKREVNDLRARGGSADRMVGSSSAISNLRRIIEKLGPANSRVLISGAAGSGKELAARLIHKNSTRANGPFVVINAPTMSPREWKRNCLESNPASKGKRGSVRSKRRMAVRSTWTKLPTCRARRRPRSSASWSIRTSCASAAPHGFLWTCALFRRPAAIWRRRLPRDVFAKTFFIGSRWCLFAFRR